MAFAHERWNRRALLGFGGALLGARVGLLDRPALAGRGWCRSDPVVLIDGVLADVFTSGPLDALLTVTGPTQIVITTPQDVTISLAIPGLGFGRGERVTFQRSKKLKSTNEGIELKIAVFVPAKKDFEVTVDFAPRVVGILKPRSADGRSNDWIDLSTKL